MSNLIKHYRKMHWPKDDEPLPAMQGLLIQSLIHHYRIPAQRVGHEYGGWVCIETKRQILFWADHGSHASFEGIMDKTPDGLKVREGKPKDATVEVKLPPGATVHSERVMPKEVNT